MPTETAPYPGVATPQIYRITQAATNGGDTELTIYVEWDHGDPPRLGLPTWVQVKVTDSDGAPVVNLPSESFVVPTSFDLVTRKAVLKRSCTFNQPGEYTVVVDPGHPEMNPTAPKTIRVE